MLVCPQGQMGARFQEAVAPLEGLALICHSLAEYPSAGMLARAMRLYAPDVVVLSFEHVQLASAVMRLIEGEVRGLPVIGINPTAESSVLLQAMRMGTREFLVMPFQREALAEGLLGVRAVLEETPLTYTHTEHIYSFLPSKPGVGATTLAMNITAAVARRGDARVLLTDLDLGCGMIRFLLTLPPGSVMDAIQRSAEMDLELWRQTVFHRDGVDILHSGGLDPQAQLDPLQVQCLIDFARKDYQFMCFDMSGNLEQYSLQVMNESKEVFIVCTPDVISLALAREKLDWLTKAGLRDRVSLLLNRDAHNLAIEGGRVESMVGAPVRAVFGNHYKQVEKAIMSATWVEPDSRLGKEFSEFASLLMGAPASAVEALAAALAEVRPLVPHAAPEWAEHR